jgi:hypothetical protein
MRTRSKRLRFSIVTASFVLLNVLLVRSIEPIALPAEPHELDQVYPAKIPVNSSEALIEVFSDDFPNNLSVVMTAKIGSVSIAALRISPVQVSAVIPASFLQTPGSLKIVLGPSQDGAGFKPVNIEVFRAKHQADLRITSTKSAVGFDESFSVKMTLTNRSPYPVYVTKNVDWAIEGGLWTSYNLEVRPSSVPVFFVPKVVDVLQGINPSDAEVYRSMGFIVRLEPGEAHTVSVDDLRFTDLLKKSPFPATAKGAFILRLQYGGLELPRGATSTIAPLDEPLYSNQIEIQVSR